MSDKGRVYCRTPIVPKRKFPKGFPANVARLMMETGLKWAPGSVLTYYFLKQPTTLAGREADKRIARQGFDAWKNLGINVTFEEVTDPAKAKIRIGFKGDDGYWSYIGREILNTHYNCHSCPASGFPSDANPPVCPNCGSTDLEVEPRTMNLDRNSLTFDPRGKDVPTHEIGHTLGLPHEHQSPFAGIEWNTQAVYDYFSGPPNNWSKEMIDSNILDKLNKDDVKGSEWDPDSIMEYEFGAGLIIKPEKYKAGLTPAGGISQIDQKWIKFWYPTSQNIDELKLNEPIALNLKPREGKEFYFIAPETRAYDFQTFGDSDTVIVLFEEMNGKRNQLDADDDSAEDWNAHIRHDLKEGNKYILSIRLYWKWSSGDTTVKVW